jgi:enediyne biosynthesis protein E3
MVVSALRSRLLGIEPGEASFARRGFHAGAPNVRERLEAIGAAFVTGYNERLRARGTDEAAVRLERVEADLRGFAFEGAAMAATLIDRLSGGGTRRWRELLDGPGERYSYLLYVGAGWAWARLPVDVDRARRRLDPLHGWLGVDGLGFHHGYFAATEGGVSLAVPRRLRGYARRAFDQGLGRSLWFVHCASVERIAAAIAAAAPERQADLWSGVGLAATYAGPIDRGTAAALLAAGAGHAAALAQGGIFGATARVRGRNTTSATEAACAALAGLDTRRAAELAAAALPRGADARSDAAYERWRSAIRSQLTPSFGHSQEVVVDGQ